jgi:hypothetical protein
MGREHDKAKAESAAGRSGRMKSGEVGGEEERSSVDLVDDMDILVACLEEVKSGRDAKDTTS